MFSESERLRELAKLYRELSELVIVGSQERHALADLQERRADSLEGIADLDVSSGREARD